MSEYHTIKYKVHSEITFPMRRFESENMKKIKILVKVNASKYWEWYGTIPFFLFSHLI